MLGYVAGEPYDEYAGGYADLFARVKSEKSPLRQEKGKRMIPLVSRNMTEL